MTLKDQLDSLANAIASHATDSLDGKASKKKQENAINLQEAIDAFKALVQYHALQLKMRKKPSEDESGDESFADFSRTVAEDPNGKVSNRRAGN